jgi:hypothetical protein
MYVRTHSGLGQVGSAYLTQLRREARRNCAGVDVLLRLTRLTPLERVQRARRKLNLIPHLFSFKKELEARLKADPTNPDYLSKREDFRKIIDSLFGEGYGLSSERDELARARCELSRARVEWEESYVRGF